MLIFTNFTINFIILPNKALLLNLKVVVGWGGGGCYFFSNKHCIPSIMYNSLSSLCYRSIGLPIDIYTQL